MQNEKKKDTALFFMRLFPQISWAYSLIVLGFTNVLSDVNDDVDDDTLSGSFDPFDEAIRTSLIYMACEAVGYTAIVLLLER